MKTIRIILLYCVLFSAATHAFAQDIFDTDVMEVQIRFEDPAWREILTMSRNAGSNKRLAADVTIDGVTYRDVQVRFKGNSSFHGAQRAGYKKLPFNLKAPDGQRFGGGYETIKLANNYRDPSAIREKLAYTIAGTYVPVPHCTHAAVTVNDTYLGVYTAMEGIEGEMTRRYFCPHRTGLINADPDISAPSPQNCRPGAFASLEYLGDDPECYARLYDVKDPDEIRRIIRLARMLQDSVDEIEEILDVHLTLWMHAINNTLVNLDSYLGFFSHNYYLFDDPEGIIHPLMWDFNLAFGGFHVIRSGEEADLATLSPVIHDKLRLDERPLLTKLLEKTEYRYLYLSMVRTILDDWLADQQYLDLAKAMQASIRPYILKEVNTFYDAAAFDQNLYQVLPQEDRNIPGVAELMDIRVPYLLDHPLLQMAFLDVPAWHLQPAGDGWTLQVRTAGGVVRAHAWVRKSDCGAYHKIQMTAVTGTSDFSCALPASATQFYLELEGAYSAHLWPLQAPSQTLSVREFAERAK